MNYKRTALALLSAVCVAGLARAATDGQDARKAERFEKRDLSMFKAHREAFMARMAPGSAAIFRSSPETDYASTNAIPYRQHPDFYYLTGFEEPNAVAVLVPGSEKGKYVLFVRPRDKAAETWTGRRAGPAGAKSEFGADDAFTVDQMDEELPKILKNVGRLYWSIGFEDEAFEKRLMKIVGKLTYDGSRTPTPVTEISDPRPILHEMRLIKDAAEIALLRKACEISARAHVETMKATRPGMKEYELQAVAEYHFRKSGAARVGYLSIVGSGPNGTILHYNTNRANVVDGDLILMDAGAEYQMYTADVTRTWPANGKFTPAQREIYEVVRVAQQAAIEKIRPGATFMQIHNESLRRVTEGLKALGLVKGDIEEALREKRFTPFFMHGTGHWVGLDVHDAGRYKNDEDSRVLAPGMVLTVEPGVYVSEDAEDVDAKYKGIGVRIEDTLLVTEKGCENMSAAAPRDIADIERLLGSAGRK